MRFLISFLAAVTFASAVSAFGNVPSLRVTQLGGGDFLVEHDSQAELVDYWCAAGRFVTITLAMPDRTRVYRLSPPPRKAGQGISFTLDASKSAGATGLSTFGGPQDGSMSAGGAFSGLCRFYEFEDN